MVVIHGFSYFCPGAGSAAIGARAPSVIVGAGTGVGWTSRALSCWSYLTLKGFSICLGATRPAPPSMLSRSPGQWCQGTPEGLRPAPPPLCPAGTPASGIRVCPPTQYSASMPPGTRQVVSRYARMAASSTLASMPRRYPSQWHQGMPEGLRPAPSVECPADTPASGIKVCPKGCSKWCTAARCRNVRSNCQLGTAAQRPALWHDSRCALGGPLPRAPAWARGGVALSAEGASG